MTHPKPTADDRARDAYFLTSALVQKGDKTGHRAGIWLFSSESEAVGHYTKLLLAEGYAVLDVMSVPCAVANELRTKAETAEAENARLREALITIERMSTFPDHAVNTMTLVAAHKVARAALQPKPAEE